MDQPAAFPCEGREQESKQERLPGGGANSLSPSLKTPARLYGLFEADSPETKLCQEHRLRDRNF